MQQRFEGKVALVTGASAGIGRATAQRLASEGASVLCADVVDDKLKETVALLGQHPGRFAARHCDVSDEQQCNDCVQACIKEFGQLDVLCNIAGVLTYHHFHEVTLEDWQRIINTNLGGTFLMSRAALPHLLKTKGNIVNIASTTAWAGLPWGTAYSASKGGILALTRSIAVEYARQGVRANSISPGDIDTYMGKEAGGRIPKDADFKFLDRCRSISGPRGPEVVASVIAMLASEDGIHMNGADLRVDGATLS